MVTNSETTEISKVELEKLQLKAEILEHVTRIRYHENELARLDARLRALYTPAEPERPQEDEL